MLFKVPNSIFQIFMVSKHQVTDILDIQCLISNTETLKAATFSGGTVFSSFLSYQANEINRGFW